MQISIGNGNSPRLWLDAYHTPLVSVAPGFSWQCDLGRWRSLEPCFALCVKIIFLIQYANYVASTALMGTVFAFWLFFPCIFINYCDYRMNHREFLWLVVASQCQMSSDINILYHSYQQLVNITRNGLNTKHSLHFSAYFTFLSILVNFPLTGNDICHSQPKPWYFLISNASRWVNLLLAQWRHISSESAASSMLHMCSISIKYDAKSKAWDILLVLTSVAGNLCKKCPSGESNKNCS